MQLIGPSYNLESRPASVQRTINMVPVPLEPGNERAAWVFKDVPGFEKAVTEWDTSAPPVDPPVASFWALPNGPASYSFTNEFNPCNTGSCGTLGMQPEDYIGAMFAQYEFSQAANSFAPMTFEPGGPTITAGSYVDAASGATVTISSPVGGLANNNFSAADNGRYSVSHTINSGPDPVLVDGGSFYWQAGGGTSHAVTITFSKPMVSFGLYLIDYLDFGGTVSWQFSLGGVPAGSPTTILPLQEGTVMTTGRNGSVGFVGVIAQTDEALFDSVVLNFSGSSSGDTTGLDNIFVGTLEQMAATRTTVGQPIQFTDTSTGGPTSWLWNFGDGTTSTLQNPTKSYSTAGTRTVTLTVTNAGGSDTETKTGYVVVT